MKISTFLQFFPKALLVVCFLSGLNVQAQSSSTFSMPRHTMYYYHDGNNWNHISNTIHTYNTEGLETEAIATNPVTNQNQVKKITTYNSSGFLTAQTQYYWQNAAWTMVSAFQNTVTYTSANKIAQLIHSNMNGSASWTNEFRYDYTYDGNHNLLEETYFSWDQAATLWLQERKTAYTYDANGTITQKQYLIYANNAWSIDRTETFTAWHIPNTLPASYNTTSNLPDIRRNTTTLNPNGGHTNLTEMSFDSGINWMNFSRITELKDAHGNIETKKFESFNLGANTWLLASEEQNLRTYNSQSDITQMIVRQGGSNFQISGPPIDRYKYIYSNFQYFPRNGLGVKENKLSKLDAAVFPNPAIDKVQIEFPEQKLQALTATISDLTGKAFFSQSFKATEAKQLNIEALPKGIYMLQLQTEAGTVVKRIVKQ